MKKHIMLLALGILVSSLLKSSIGDALKDVAKKVEVLKENIMIRGGNVALTWDVVFNEISTKARTITRENVEEAKQWLLEKIMYWKNPSNELRRDSSKSLQEIQNKFQAIIEKIKQVSAGPSDYDEEMVQVYIQLIQEGYDWLSAEKSKEFLDFFWTKRLPSKAPEKKIIILGGSKTEQQKTSEQHGKPRKIINLVD